VSTVSRVGELHVVVGHGALVDFKGASVRTVPNRGIPRKHVLDPTTGGLGPLIVVDDVAQPDNRPEELLGVDDEGDERSGVSAPVRPNTGRPSTHSPPTRKVIAKPTPEMTFNPGST